MLRDTSQLRLGLPGEAGPDQVWASLSEDDRQAILVRLAGLLTRCVTTKAAAS